MLCIEIRVAHFFVHSRASFPTDTVISPICLHSTEFECVLVDLVCSRPFSRSIYIYKFSIWFAFFFFSFLLALLLIHNLLNTTKWAIGKRANEARETYDISFLWSKKEKERCYMYIFTFSRLVITWSVGFELRSCIADHERRPLARMLVFFFFIFRFRCSRAYARSFAFIFVEYFASFFAKRNTDDFESDVHRNHTLRLCDFVFVPFLRPAVSPLSSIISASGIAYADRAEWFWMHGRQQMEQPSALSHF